MMFNMWLDIFLVEKGIDLEETFTIAGPSGDNFMNYQLIVDFIKVGSIDEQFRMKIKLVELDFLNADIKDFFRHIAQAVAQ